MPTKYIFVTGGVVSSLGKGLASASIGALLEGHGYRIGGDLICPACLDKYYREEI